MADRPQNRKKNGKRRPVYDQARDTRPSRPADRSNVGYPSSTTPGRHPVTNPNYDPDAPRPSRYAARDTGSGSYPDNSIQFPTGGRPVQKQNPSRNRAPNAPRQNQRRTSAPQSQRPRNGQARPQNPNARRPASGQRLRPTQANLRDPARREGKKKRKMTRKALRRRRAIQRLTALAMLLCVIAAGIYLTVTMLFKINTIEVRTAEGVVSEAGGYSSEQILQALGVQKEENIFSFDPAAKAAALEKVVPMLEDIRVERDYPSTVVVRVTEAQPAYAMQTAKGWLTLSAGLKILTADSAQPTGLPTLYGGELLGPRRAAVLRGGNTGRQQHRFGECLRRGQRLRCRGRGGRRQAAGSPQHPADGAGYRRDARGCHPHRVRRPGGDGVPVSGPHQRPTGHPERTGLQAQAGPACAAQ